MRGGCPVVSERLLQIALGRWLHCVIVRREQLQRKLLRTERILGAPLGAPPLAFLRGDLVVSPFRFLAACSIGGWSDDSSLRDVVFYEYETRVFDARMSI
jgi:hypothetical protein